MSIKMELYFESERFTLQKPEILKAECQLYERLYKGGTKNNNRCTLVSEIAKAREHIKNSLEKMDGIATLAATPVGSEIFDRIGALERDNLELRKSMNILKNMCHDSQKRLLVLEEKLVMKKAAVDQNLKNNDELNLFTSESDEEDNETAKIRKTRLAAYEAQKKKKPAIIAKSSVLLDVKPWDDETDLNVIEMQIREIISDGLLWGASKLVPIAYGIQKLSISCVVEDEKVSVDWLIEEIEKLSDFVQSVDVAAFNKI